MLRLANSLQLVPSFVLHPLTQPPGLLSSAAGLLAAAAAAAPHMPGAAGCSSSSDRRSSAAPNARAASTSAAAGASASSSSTPAGGQAGSGSGAGAVPGARPPLPPFTEETARLKVQMAEDAWNSRDPARVALAYSEGSEWRNRAHFLVGREEIRQFLSGKWARERHYALRKYLWAFTDNRIAVCFEYEYQAADSGQWFRAYGNENWEFDEAGLMRKRIASINEAPIQPHERRISLSGALEGGGPAGGDAGGGGAGGAAAAVPENTWLSRQGLAGGPRDSFPMGGGHEPCY